MKIPESQSDSRLQTPRTRGSETLSSNYIVGSFKKRETRLQLNIMTTGRIPRRARTKDRYLNMTIYRRPPFPQIKQLAVTVGALLIIVGVLIPVIFVKPSLFTTRTLSAGTKILRLNYLHVPNNPSHRLRHNQLLMHVSYYHYASMQSTHCDSGILKGSKQWNDAMWVALVQQIVFADQYSEMDRVDIVVDTNDDGLSKAFNSTVAGMQFGRVNVSFRVHTELSHPFHLTSRHRIQMEEVINKYTHFMYTEVDTVMPPETFSRQLKEAELLWGLQPPAVRTYTRMCSNHASPTQLAVGFFDVLSHSQRHNIVQMNDKKFILPNSTYSACWVYPRYVLKELMSTSRWDTTDAKFNTATGLNAIRELQSKPLHDRALIPLDHEYLVPRDVFVWHLGGSGALYCSKYCVKHLTESFVTKRFAYLINTRMGRSSFVSEVLVSHDADAFVLAWGNSNTEQSDLYVPNSTWNSGRNAVYEYVRKREEEQGWEYEYYIMLDEDGMNLDCDHTLGNSASPASKRYDFRRRCWSAFEDRLIQDKPAVASPHMIDVPLSSSYQQSEDEPVSCIFSLDAQVNAISSPAARKLLPYLVFGGQSWVTGTMIMLLRASTLYLGDVLLYSQFQVSNQEHKHYPGNGKYGGASMFSEQLRKALEQDEKIFLCASLGPPAWKVYHQLNGKYRIANCSSYSDRQKLKSAYRHDWNTWEPQQTVTSISNASGPFCLIQNCEAEADPIASNMTRLPCLIPNVERDEDFVLANLRT